jgi:hypothetical protein
LQEFNAFNASIHHCSTPLTNFFAFLQDFVFLADLAFLTHGMCRHGRLKNRDFSSTFRIWKFSARLLL